MYVHSSIYIFGINLGHTKKTSVSGPAGGRSCGQSGGRTFFHFFFYDF